MWKGWARRARRLFSVTALAALGASCGPSVTAPVAPAKTFAVAPPEPPAPKPAPTAKAPRPRPDTNNMVQVSGGSYVPMVRDPSDDENEKRIPGAAVTVAPFWMDVTPVTALDYAKCVVDGGCTDEGLDCIDDPRGFREHSVPTYGSFSRADHPINCVSQVQATAYCDRLGKRLPTANEWGWAARGADRRTRFPWGDQLPNLWDDKTYTCWGHDYFGDEEVPTRVCDYLFYGCILVADYRRKPPDGTCSVRAHPMGNSPQGLADLLGNVIEWTSTVVSEEKAGRTEPSAFMVGSCWRTYDPAGLDIDWRTKDRVSLQVDTTGFRCAWTDGAKDN